MNICLNGFPSKLIVRKPNIEVIFMNNSANIVAVTMVKVQKSNIKESWYGDHTLATPCTCPHESYKSENVKKKKPFQHETTMTMIR